MAMMLMVAMTRMTIYSGNEMYGACKGLLLMVVAVMVVVVGAVAVAVPLRGSCR